MRSMPVQKTPEVINAPRKSASWVVVHSCPVNFAHTFAKYCVPSSSGAVTPVSQPSAQCPGLYRLCTPSRLITSVPAWSSHLLELCLGSWTGLQHCLVIISWLPA